MNDELAGRERARTHVPRGRRFKRHELELADGGRLVLHIDGSIDQIGDDDSMTHSWMPDDPEWPAASAPQQARVPSALMAQLCSPPALIKRNVPGGALAWPATLAPQQAAVP